MQSFLEYLREQQKQLEEDAVLAAGSVAPDNAVASPKAYDQMSDNSVSSPKACVGLTDNSVLGGATRKKDGGFFGKDDFVIPKNVLSGEIDVKIDRRK